MCLFNLLCPKYQYKPNNIIKVQMIQSAFFFLCQVLKSSVSDTPIVCPCSDWLHVKCPIADFDNVVIVTL